MKMRARRRRYHAHFKFRQPWSAPRIWAGMAYEELVLWRQMLDNIMVSAPPRSATRA